MTSRGGSMKSYALAVAATRRKPMNEGIWLEGVFEQQNDLFRARAFQVCVGLQSLRMSALEMCEVLAHMFAPLESTVPFHLHGEWL
jgi:hypothetical protein